MDRWLPEQPGDQEPDQPRQQPDITPLPGPQVAAVQTEADELLYGGAAGGGKSYLLIGLAAMTAYQTIIFRREYPQLAEIQDKLDELLPDAKTNRVAKRWTFDRGRFVELGAMLRPKDWRKYKGRPHDLIGFDELSEFTREQYRMGILWNRTHLPGVRCRVVATTNPPTSEDERWIIEDWGPWLQPGHAHAADPGELRWYSYDGDALVWFDSPGPHQLGEREVFPKSRTFIPAKLEDNPYLMASGYGRTLDALPEIMRRAFREGDFSVSNIGDPWATIPSGWVDDRMKAERPPDLGPLTHIGCDPARGGKDQTILALRHGSHLTELVIHPGKSTPDGPSVAALVMRYWQPGVQVIVDVIGIGASVYDSLVANGVPTTGFNASTKSTMRDKSGLMSFANARAAAYWKVRELVDPKSSESITLPDDAQLLAELSAPKFKLTTAGILVEKKDNIKTRLGRSPDRADAAVYAFQEPDNQLFVV